MPTVEEIHATEQRIVEIRTMIASDAEGLDYVSLLNEIEQLIFNRNEDIKEYLEGVGIIVDGGY